jgi:hypothetical protein
MELKVKRLDIEDKMQKFGEQFKHLATSHFEEGSAAGDHLLMIQFTNIQSDSPEYAMIDSKAVFDFNTLNVLFNRETVVTLIDMVNKTLEAELSK